MFATLDWIILGAYLILALGAGLALSKKATSSLDSYFLANRNLPWWWLGTSMVATTFAADTPLAITGITVKQGISGNWFWWSWALTYFAAAIFFARKWRRAKVLTDIEFIELRYGRPAGSWLRLFKAGYMSLILNSIILGWVFRAMAKITTPFLRWNEILPASAFEVLLTAWPSFLMLGAENYDAVSNLNHTITLYLLFAGVVTYSILGGIRGVILTDLIQFTMAMTGSFVFAYLALQYAGGMDNVLTEIRTGYPDQGSQQLSILPDITGLAIGLFGVYFLVQWWSQYFSDGSGYLAQRMNTARTPDDATKGSLWFVTANFILRTWPWIIIGLVTLAVIPLSMWQDGSAPSDVARQCAALAGKGSVHLETGSSQGSPIPIHGPAASWSAADIQMVCMDPEMGYPILMKYVLPVGLLGFVFAGLMAAFMSTVDTHINWAASYLVNDVYLRFVDPGATDRQRIRISRFLVLFVALVSVAVATRIGSIEEAWKFLIALAAGMGLPQILRWIWWRANAWTEISGMVSSLLLTILLYSLYPTLKEMNGWQDLRPEFGLLFTAVGSALACVIVTLLTEPTNASILDEFKNRVKPSGFWRGPNASVARREFLQDALFWLTANVALLSGMLIPGYLLLGQNQPALISAAIAAPFLAGSIYLYRVRSTD
jgi:SSS family solute:Na+ symporter